MFAASVCCFYHPKENTQSSFPWGGGKGHIFCDPEPWLLNLMLKNPCCLCSTDDSGNISVKSHSWFISLFCFVFLWGAVFYHPGSWTQWVGAGGWDWLRGPQCLPCAPGVQPAPLNEDVLLPQMSEPSAETHPHSSKETCFSFPAGRAENCGAESGEN